MSTINYISKAYLADCGACGGGGDCGGDCDGGGGDFFMKLTIELTTNDGKQTNKCE